MTGDYFVFVAYRSTVNPCEVSATNVGPFLTLPEAIEWAEATLQMFGEDVLSWRTWQPS